MAESTSTSPQPDRRGGFRLSQRQLLAVLPLSVLALITLGPLPVSLLDVTVSVAQWVAGLLGAASGRPTRAEVEGWMNVVAPAVVVLVLAAGFPRTGLGRFLVGGLLAAAAIEIAQLALPGRHPELRDFVLNSIGVLAGCALGFFVRRLRRTSAT